MKEQLLTSQTRGGKITARYVRFNNIRPSTTSYTTITELEIINTDLNINWCRQTGSIASSNGGGYQGIQIPANAIDGFIDDIQQHRWSTASAVDGDGVWFQVDLGQLRSINLIRFASLVGYGQEPKSLYLEISNDEVDWQILKIFSNITYSGSNVFVNVYPF